MKKILALIFSCLLAFTCVACSNSNEELKKNWEDDGVLKILTIGNSFSDDAMEWVYDIAQSAGVKVYLGNLFYGGCSLFEHYNFAQNAKANYEYRVNENGEWITEEQTVMDTALKAQDWDYISFQQASGDSGKGESYNDQKQLDNLLKFVRERVGDKPKFVWHMTWAYQTGSDHDAFRKYFKNQQTMYEGIVSAVQSEITTREEFSVIIPSGTAIQNARTSFVGDTLTRDGYHLSYKLGRYIAGLTLFGSLSGVGLDTVIFAPEGVTEEEKAMAIKSAGKAIKKPFKITNI